MDSSAWSWVLDHVLCPVCRSPLAARELSLDGRDGVLAHDRGSCDERYPVIGAIPRLLVGAARAQLRADRADWFASSPYRALLSGWLPGTRGAAPADLRLVARFDREWQAYGRVGTAEQTATFARYFDVVPPELIAPGRVALDAGCGGGRWAYELTSRGPRVIAVDLGLSVEVAERNTRSTGRVACVQADVRAIPVRARSVDLAYSLGVLHHVEQTDEALRAIAALVRPGGALLLYLYYALDSRPLAYRALFRAANAIRVVTSSLPQRATAVVATAVAVGAYYPLARLARGLRRVGLGRAAAALPLSFYADLSFETMRNDSLDRFGTALEKRYTRQEVEAMLRAAGLVDVAISAGAPFWHGVGRARSG